MGYVTQTEGKDGVRACVLALGVRVKMRVPMPFLDGDHLISSALCGKDSLFLAMTWLRLKSGYTPFIERKKVSEQIPAHLDLRGRHVPGCEGDHWREFIVGNKRGSGEQSGGNWRKSDGVETV